MAKRIVREPEACNRLGVKRTKFRTHYRFNDPADPLVPNLNHPRLRPAPIGVRNLGYLEHEIEQLIDALAKLRDTAPAVPRITHSAARKEKRSRAAGRR